LQRHLRSNVDPIPTETSQQIPVIRQLLATLGLLRIVHEPRDEWAPHGRPLQAGEFRELFELVFGVLFQRKANVYAAAMAEYADHVDQDLTALDGLLIWLAWEAGADMTALGGLRRGELDMEKGLDVARLVHLGEIAAADPQAVDLAEMHIRATTQQTGGPRDSAAWLSALRQWGFALRELRRGLDSWQRHPPDTDGLVLGIAIREATRRIRPIRAIRGSTVEMFDCGEARALRASDTVLFQDTAVVFSKAPWAAP
jgi:hypothetical protein